MTETTSPAESTETNRTDELYIPAASLKPALGRVEEVFAGLFGRHGVVLIPDSYNK
ncbi:MAG: hypothetical protein ABEH56_07845 [Salinirussus sp.]